MGGLLTTTEIANDLRFEPPGPGFWEQDPVHLPRAATRYWVEVHPSAFARGTADFASFYGMLIGGLRMAYVNGIGYKTVVPPPEEEIPQRFARAEQVFAGTRPRSRPRSRGTASCRRSTRTRSRTRSSSRTSAAAATITRP